MIRIELDDATLARTRIATSPLWETAAAALLLHRHAGRPAAAPWPYAGWVRHARETLTPRAARAVGVLAARGGVPDFVTPAPPSAAPTFEEEIAALRATDPAVVRAETIEYFGGGYGGEAAGGEGGSGGGAGRPAPVPAEFEPFVADPAAALAGFTAGLAEFWDLALAPYWPAMRTALEEEILIRARALAAHGPESLLGDLHDRVRWEPPALTLVKSVRHRHVARDRRLVLVPLLFSPGALVCCVGHPEIVAVSYQARGAAVLADGPGPREVPPAADRLSALVGRGRAAVLRSLVRPATTAALAAELGLAASTVSEHLAGLHAAGMVHRSRAGRRVLYGLEPAGVALLNLLEPVDPGSGRAEFRLAGTG